MARQFGSEQQKMFVKQYSARPVIVIKSKDPNREIAFTFADVVARFGVDLDEANYSQAYWRSGTAFKGQLEQTFVILNEK